MSFLKRLGFFLFGLSIGIVFLVFFFKNKAKETGTEFCYLPNCRVLKDLRSKSYSYSEEVTRMLDAGEIDSLGVKENSDTKSTPCKTYLIENETESGAIKTLTVINCPTKISIESIK